ncbi:FUSC family protein [Segnochrobactraceae bacterium EtOH-i3]
MAPAGSASPAPRPGPGSAAFWQGNALGARTARFTLTVMGPFAAVPLLGEGGWIAYALLIAILGFMMDVGGPVRVRLAAIAIGAAVILAGAAIGTATTHSEAGLALALAGAGVAYALVESLHPSAAFAARFLCISLAVGSLYVPLTLTEAAIVAGFVVYTGLVSVLWDRATGQWRPRTGPHLRDVVAHIRASRCERLLFAAIVAVTVCLAFLTSEALGLKRPQWTLLAIVVGLKADPVASRKMIGHFLAGTLVGVAIALGFGTLVTTPKGLLVGVTLAAAARWPAQQIHTVLGVAAITAFALLILELVAVLTHTASHAPLDRAVDVLVGCGFALVALELNLLAQRRICRTGGAA